MPAHLGPMGHAASATPSSATTTAGAADGAPAAPTVAQVVDRVFERFDADADGLITPTEIAVEVDPAATHTDLTARIASLVSAIDGNGDGSLNRDEVTAAVAALDSNADGTLARSEWPAPAAADDTAPSVALLLGGRPGGHAAGGHPPGDAPAAQTIDGIVALAFDRLDADGNGALSLSELLSLVDAQGKLDLSALMTDLFTAVDSNGDQGLSAAELRAALTAADTNANGSIDAGELPPPHAWDQASVQLIGVLVHELHHPEAGG